MKNTEKSVCFTGHRPQKLPWGFDESHKRFLEMRDNARREIVESIHDGYDTFISGMALGFDTTCAELVLELKEEYPHIQLILAIPCRNQDSMWNSAYRKRYAEILQKADYIHYISDKYTNTCMFARNEYMLNNCSKVIALYDGTGGGTAYTIHNAKKLNKNIVIIKP